jgi:hypothetical protein
MFTATLLLNGHGADHKKTPFLFCSTIVAFVSDVAGTEVRK